MYGASSKFGELPLTVASSNLQFDSNNYNEKINFGIGIKPTKNKNLTGAMSNLMYYSAFRAMGLTAGHLTPSSVTLVNFAGEKTRALGTIKLSMTLGITPRQITTLADFLILDKAPSHNVILGRSTLNKIRVAVSTCTLTMKFPTPHGVGEIRGTQAEGRFYHFGAMKEVWYA